MLKSWFCHEIDNALRDLDNTENFGDPYFNCTQTHFCAGATFGEMAEMTAEEVIVEQFTGCVSSLP